MTYGYALQIVAVSMALSILGLGGLFVASRLYDRNTRRMDAATRVREPD